MNRSMPVVSVRKLGQHNRSPLQRPGKAGKTLQLAGSGLHAHMLYLQQAVGNRSALQLRGAAEGASPIMPKLIVNDANDAFEEEADQVAFRVVSEINKTHPWETSIQLKESQAGQMQEEEDPQAESGFGWGMMALGAAGNKKKGKKNKKEKQGQQQPGTAPAVGMRNIQRKQEPHGSREGGGGNRWIERSIRASVGKGDTVPRKLREQMESIYGKSLEDVTIHMDDNAERLTEALGARAFATGKDIYFGQGEFNPHTRGGQHLIAHELTHILQQNG